ncbi:MULTISPECIES: DUF4345 family protein [unclassified Roseitalea]|uniref:AGROH133_08824 family phage infection protein n=1 Tax=unclassified Roseitalea TaxID=2639107 RepID=UPI00273D3A04|nr:MULTISPECIES: DUF4345 family protein [unclassified Roseitalea]
MLTLIPPQSPGEWLAWASAIVTIGFGLICLIMPRTTFRILRLQARPGVPEALSESRATMAGFYLATGLLAIAFAQPFVWMVLGAGWAFTALGRLVSIIADDGNTTFNWVSIAMEIALAAAPLAYAFGIVR